MGLKTDGDQSDKIIILHGFNISLMVLLYFCATLSLMRIKFQKIARWERRSMRKERRKVKHIKMDLARSYSGMEAKVDARAKEVFKRKPYTVVHL